MDRRPLLSIVIPTKDRQYYCFEVIKHIISLNLPSTQLVIQDNSLKSDLKRILLQESIYNKIIYNHSPEELSFIDNFNKALEFCQGEYICMIGDDDSVLPNIIEEVKYAKDNDLDALIPELFAYFWPSNFPIKPSYKNGYLSFRNFPNHTYKYIKPLDSIKRLIKNNFQDYQYLGIPRLYHGIVKRERIEMIKNKIGSYFDGLTPDIFISICLCFTCNKVATLSIPITISGICPASGSSASATGKHTGSLNEAPHFKGHKSYTWFETVPYIYTVETIWAETGLQALKKMAEYSYLALYDPRSFVLYLYVKYPQFKHVLEEEGKLYNISKMDFYKYRFKNSITYFIKRVKMKILRIFGIIRIYNYENIGNISQAGDIVISTLK